MVDKATMSLKDYDSERASTTINIADITAANIDAIKADLSTLRAATEAIMRQGFFSTDLSDNTYTANPSVTDQFSQREIKWAINVEDNLGNVYKANEIPCANLAFLENNSKYIYKNKAVTVTANAAAVTAFVTAFEALAKSKSGGTLTVVDIWQVGRNI